MNSPARHNLPSMASAPSPRGGNLASAPSAGHFYSPSLCPPEVPCSILLSRDARSASDVGLDVLAVNRADCKRQGRGLDKPSDRLPLPALSILFIQSAHQFGTDDANRHEARSVLRPVTRKAGAVGLLPVPPRPLPFLHVDDFAHRGGSIRSLSRNGERPRRAFHQDGKINHACDL